MSGIAGIYYLDGRSIERADLEGMIDSLAQRGPDGGGSWLTESVGLGQRMLWTTPESLHERLPLLHDQTGLVITADARIDNRVELIATLGLACPPREIVDSELILHAYEKWGEACPEKLIGDFAFAIWDARQGKLFAARDPMGLKPFYYYHCPGRLFAFASQIQPLFCVSGVPRRVNELRVAYHLSFLFDNRSLTFYQDISQLQPAHRLVVDTQGLSLKRYWELDVGREIRLPSEEAYSEAFLEMFSQAVHCRLRSAFPMGSCLSGGLDSSSIVAVARKIFAQEGTDQRLHTFSVIFPDLAGAFPKIDERPWIDPVVAQGGLEPHYILGDRLDPLTALSFNADEPIPMANLWLYWGCFEAAHQSGVRGLFSGYDGDTAISYGFGFLAELARDLRWATLLKEAHALARKYKWPLSRVVKEQALKPLIPNPLWNIWRKLRKRPPESLFPFDPLVDPFFALQVSLYERARALNGAGGARFESARQLHKLGLESDFVLYGVELIDKLGAAWSIEPRLPFFDQRLLEFSLALPTGQKLHDGWNRYVVRRAMQGILPAEVQWRQGKGNLSSNIRRGLHQNRPVLDHVLFQEVGVARPYMNVPVLHAAYQRFNVQPMQSSEADVFSIIAAYTLIQWLSKV